MAIVLVPGDIIETRFYCSAGGQWAQNVRQWEVGVVVAPAHTDVEVAAAIAGSDVPLWYKDCLSSNARYEGLTVQRISGVPTMKVVNKGGNNIGNRLGDLLPPATAGLISLKSNVATRKGRGRIYIPFPAETDSDAGGHPTLQIRVNMAVLGDYFTTSVTYTKVGGGDITLRPILLNRPTMQTIDLVSDTVRTEWATMRRRSFIRGGDAPPI